MREAEFYPASFLDQVFTLNHDFFEKLHALEEAQIQALREQMAAHQRLIDSISHATEAPHDPSDETAEDPEPTQAVIPPAKPEQTKESQSEIVSQPQKVVSSPVVQPVQETQTTGDSSLSGGKISLNEVIEKKSLTDFRRAISLNDWFRFKRDLFKGNEEAINATIQALNGTSSYEEAIAYLNGHTQWDPDDPTAADFIKLLEKRFL